MTKNIENKFEVGDWARCTVGEDFPHYINITKENLEKYNNEEAIKNYSLTKVSKEDILRRAQEYFVEVVSLKKGDYLNFKDGKNFVVDRIVDIPKIEGNLLSIDSYMGPPKSFHPYMVRTETGHELKYFNAVHNKISDEKAKELLDKQVKIMELNLKKFKSQSDELNIKKFF